MNPEVIEDQYDMMGGILMYVDNALTDLDSAYAKLGDLIADGELQLAAKRGLRDRYQVMRTNILQLNAMRDYINSIDLS